MTKDQLFNQVYDLTQDATDAYKIRDSIWDELEQILDELWEVAYSEGHQTGKAAVWNELTSHWSGIYGSSD